MSNFRGNLFDPKSIISDLIKTDLDLNVFNLDKDSMVSFDVAPNFFTFVTTPEVYLKTSLFPRQLQWGINLFEDYCPYCSDTDFAREGLFDQDNKEIAERITFYEFGKCPKCGKTRRDATDAGYYKGIDELAVCAGMRGGKTVFTAVAASYVLHKYLMLKPTPSSYFGKEMIENQELHITFCAVQLTQAYDTLWRQFFTVYESSPWFRKYEKYLRDQEKKNKDGEKLYRKSDAPTDPSIKFFKQNIEVTCETPNIKAIRGRTRIFTAIDEIGWMDLDREKSKAIAKVTASAEETYQALIKSLMTVRSASDAKKIEQGFYDAPTGIACNISSPSNVNDMIMYLIKDPSDTRLSYHYATWEVNPYISEKKCRADSSNDVAFYRDYQATPPFANNPYFSSPLILEQSINTEYRQQSLANWSFERTVDQFGFNYIYMNINPIKTEKVIPRLLTIDTGYTHDSFAICMTHYDAHNSKIMCDLLLEISPLFPENEGCNINFVEMFDNAIKPLLENFNIKNVFYDRWNSLDQVHRIRKDYTMADQYSLKWSDFIQIRNNLYEGKFRFPLAEMTIEKFQKSKIPHWELVVNKPIIHTLVQCLTIREIGKKVIKPLLGSDDLWRSIALAMWFFDSNKNKEAYSNYSTSGMLNVRNSGKNVAVALSSYNRGSVLPVTGKYGYKISRRKPF